MTFINEIIIMIAFFFFLQLFKHTTSVHGCWGGYGINPNHTAKSNGEA